MKKQKTEKSIVFDPTAAAAVAILRGFVGDKTFHPIPGHNKTISADDIEARAVVGPFVQISIGASCMIVTLERLEIETAVSHVDVWRRINELLACLPHYWRSVSLAVLHEWQKSKKKKTIAEQARSLPDFDCIDPEILTRMTP